jgi:DNA processing protein
VRGLLDLAIARLRLSSGQKVLLCRNMESEADLSAFSRQDAERLFNRSLKPSVWRVEAARRAAEKDARYMELRGIGFVSIVSASYPPLLREIHDPPAALFYRGILPAQETPYTGIVGTRKPCGRALRWARETARDLAKAGINTVSGLALGIDAMAHAGCLDGGGKTVAVLGSGVDELYPVLNRELAARILASGGGILSEYPPGSRPTKWTFPERNRIIAGLCRGVVIVEAPARSGALITARFALEQGRDVWVAASTETADDGCFGAGCSALAGDGAGRINGAADILGEWGIEASAAADAADDDGEDSGGDLASKMARELGIEL